MNVRIVVLIAALVAAGEGNAADGAASRPNFLIVLADDLGFSDLGCYGAEIETPNLDRLAAGGVRFTQFYNTAKCHSSRISLLSGRYPYQAGNLSLQRCVTFAEMLGAAGYFTAMTGKWHLKEQPTDFGFHRYFGHLSGSCNYFTGDDTFRLNGRPWPVPAEGFYTTVANADFALKFLDEARASKKPWCLYVAFNAPHSPLQPMEEDYKKYEGRYDAGWDAIRAARVKKQAELNLFGAPVEPCPRPDHIPAWADLAPDRRDWESRRMAAYAAMVDRMDREIGRLVDNVRTAGELDNTFILFVSDNGSSPYDRRNLGRERQPFDPSTSWSLGTGWAWAGNTPFRFYKQNQFEGGIAAPAIVHWPRGITAAAGSVTHTPVHLIDVLPTLADISDARIPDTWPGRELTPLAGVSLAPALAGDSLPPRTLFFLYHVDRGLRDGDWKLVSFRSNPWELYNLAGDRTELRDLVDRHPDVRDRLAAEWFRMAEQVDMGPARYRVPVLESPEPVLHPEWSAYGAPSPKDSDSPRSKKARKAEKATKTRE